MARKKKVTVYTSGTFDLFHVGHLNILKRSKSLGDVLIVGVYKDEVVKKNKGNYPVIPLKERIEILKACKYVDKVVPQTILTDIRTLKKYKIDIVTTGDDWKNRYLKGLEWMKKHGKVVYFPYTRGISSTMLKEKISQSKE